MPIPVFAGHTRCTGTRLGGEQSVLADARQARRPRGLVSSKLLVGLPW